MYLYIIVFIDALYCAVQVPQYSEVYGYSRVDVLSVSSSYIKQVTLQSLRDNPPVCPYLLTPSNCMHVHGVSCISLSNCNMFWFNRLRFGSLSWLS